MFTIRLDKDMNNDVLDKSVSVLEAGGMIAFPTETFYGLGVRFDLPESLERLYELKRRPKQKAMPLIIGHIGLLSAIVPRDWLEHIPSPVKSLADRFWPGPLTLLLPAGKGLSEFLTAGSGMIAVRIPGESFALNLAREADFPITATSANISGMPPSVNAREVVRYFDDRIDLLVDGGETRGGLPSTIIDATKAPMKIMREGAITTKELENYLEL